MKRLSISSNNEFEYLATIFLQRFLASKTREEVVGRAHQPLWSMAARPVRQTRVSGTPVTALTVDQAVELAKRNAEAAVRKQYASALADSKEPICFDGADCIDMTDSPPRHVPPPVGEQSIVGAVGTLPVLVQWAQASAVSLPVRQGMRFTLESVQCAQTSSDVLPVRQDLLSFQL